MKSIEDGYEMLFKAYEMNTRPNKTKVADGTIIDENKSVKWNKEQVALLQEQYKETVIELQNKQNKAIKKAKDVILNAVVEYMDNSILVSDAEKIYDYVENHTCGEGQYTKSSIMYELLDLIQEVKK